MFEKYSNKYLTEKLNKKEANLADLLADDVSDYLGDTMDFDEFSSMDQEEKEDVVNNALGKLSDKYYNDGDFDKDLDKLMNRKYKEVTSYIASQLSEGIEIINEAKNKTTEFSKPGNDGDIYFSKREGNAVAVRQGDLLQSIYVYDGEVKLGKIQKTDKRWENMGKPSEKLLIDLKLKNVGGLATKATQTESGKLIYAFLSESVNEAKLSTVHRAAKKGSYPAVIVVVQDGKVIHQEPVSTPDVAPATFNVMQEKYPKALLHLEDKTGKRLFSESVNEEQGKLDFGGNELKDLTTKLWKGLQWKKKGNKYTYKYGTGFLTIELKNGKVVGAEFSEDRSYDFLKHMDDKGFGPNIYGSLSALAKDRKIKGYNTILMFESLNEGQFSWMTHDSDAQIGSEATNRVEVYMFDNEGNKWKENRYEGYGEFGGKDYYDLLATMNGYTPEDLKDKKLLKKIRVMGKPEMRQIGIALAFDDLKPKNGKKVLYPALVTNPRYNWKRHNFEEEAETDPNQSWAVEDDYDDDDDYGYYDESANESWMLPRFESFVNENENRVYGMFTDDQGKPTKLDKELLDIALKGLPSNIVKNIDAVEANGYGKSSAISPPTVSNKGQSRGEIEYHKIGIGLLKPMGKNKITAITLGLRKRTSGPGTGYLFMKVAPDWRHNLGPDAEGAIEFWEDPASFLQKLYNEKFKNWF